MCWFCALLSSPLYPLPCSRHVEQRIGLGTLTLTSYATAWQIVSAISWLGCTHRGKLGALKLMRSEHCREMFRELGQSWKQPADLFKKVEAFICKLYTLSKRTVHINTARHQLFCARVGISSLPSFHHARTTSSCIQCTLIHPSHRRRGATAVLVRHRPQWHRHGRRGFRSGFVIDRRSIAENCQNRGSRWHGGNCEHVQNFRSATAGWANSQRDRRGIAMIAATPPWPPWNRTRTAAAPPSRPCLRSSLQPPCNSTFLWAAVFTFNPYLLISINELMISIIHLLISINELLISIDELLISINYLLISINTSSSTVFIDINNSFIDINKVIIDINNSFIDINKYGWRCRIYWYQ